MLCNLDETTAWLGTMFLCASRILRSVLPEEFEGKGEGGASDTYLHKKANSLLRTSAAERGERRAMAGGLAP